MLVKNRKLQEFAFTERLLGMSLTSALSVSPGPSFTRELLPSRPFHSRGNRGPGRWLPAGLRWVRWARLTNVGPAPPGLPSALSSQPRHCLREEHGVAFYHVTRSRKEPCKPEMAGRWGSTNASKSAGLKSPAERLEQILFDLLC